MGRKLLSVVRSPYYCKIRWGDLNPPIRFTPRCILKSISFWVLGILHRCKKKKRLLNLFFLTEVSSSSGGCSTGIRYVTVFSASFYPPPFRPVLCDNPYYSSACISTAPPNQQRFQKCGLIYVRKRRCHSSDAAAAKDLVYETRSPCLVLPEEHRQRRSHLRLHRP